MLGPVDRLLDCERACEGHAGRLKLTKLQLHDAEAGERGRNLGTLEPGDRVEARDRALKQLPGRFVLPTRLLVLADRCEQPGGLLRRAFEELGVIGGG